MTQPAGAPVKDRYIDGKKEIMEKDSRREEKNCMSTPQGKYQYGIRELILEIDRNVGEWMEGLYLPRDLRILHWSRQATYGPEGGT